MLHISTQIKLNSREKMIKILNTEMFWKKMNSSTNVKVNKTKMLKKMEKADIIMDSFLLVTADNRMTRTNNIHQKTSSKTEMWLKSDTEEKPIWSELLTVIYTCMYAYKVLLKLLCSEILLLL